MGLLRIQGDGVTIHYPTESRNYFQKLEDNRTFEQDPHLLSDNVKYFHKNFEALNLSTAFQPVSTENLNKNEGPKILKLKYELEKEKYEDQADGFWQSQKEKKYNRMLSDFQKVVNRKNDYPNSDVSGLQFGEYDPITDQKKIKTTFNEFNLE